MSQHEVKSLFRRTENSNSEIEYLGGINSDGSSWKITINKAIEGIEKGKWEFFIIKNGQKIMLLVDERNGRIVLDCRNINYLELKEISL